MQTYLQNRRFITRLLSLVDVLGVLALLPTLIFTLVHPTPSRTADISNSYQWKQLKIGEGGFVTGPAIHPTISNPVYARTTHSPFMISREATEDALSSSGLKETSYQFILARDNCHVE